MLTDIITDILAEYTKMMAIIAYEIIFLFFRQLRFITSFDKLLNIEFF